MTRRLLPTASSARQGTVWLIRTTEPRAADLCPTVSNRIANQGGLRRVYASPARDAQRTADAVLQRLGPLAQTRMTLVDDRLRPPDLRILGSLPLPKARAANRREPFRFRAPGGESFADIARRLRSLLYEVTLRQAPVALVTHECVFQIGCAVALGWPDDEVVRFVRQGVVGPWATAAFSTQPGGFRLEALHRTPLPSA
jgi:2,3-bisphosphoglycerate-dependent phosphoglycerate mutase